MIKDLRTIQAFESEPYPSGARPLAIADIEDRTGVAWAHLHIPSPSIPDAISHFHMTLNKAQCEELRSFFAELAEHL